MNINYSKSIYISLLIAIFAFGLIPPLTKLLVQSTFPFFNWSLFDQAFSVVKQYAVKVTCESDFDENGPLPFILEDNSCLKLSTGANYRPRNKYMQQIIREAELNDKLNELQAKLEKIIKTTDYQKIIVYKVEYDPKRYYFTKEYSKNEKIIEFTKS